VSSEPREEAIMLAGRDVVIQRPRDPNALLDEHAFEHEEYLPYWAELWPSGLALARALAGRALHGARTLELGCGLGLPSLAAALAGGRVLATDWSSDAVDHARANAERNGASIEARVVAWGEPAALVERAPWDLVLAADVLYERRNAELLAPLLPRLVDDRGAVWLADPGRKVAEGFLDAIAKEFDRESRLLTASPPVTLHVLRRRRSDQPSSRRETRVS
jgi:predicted nicotinamide N-methyase